MVSSRPVVAATEIIGLMRGQSFLVLQLRALKNWSLDCIMTPVNQARPKRCRRITTSIKDPPTSRELVGERDFTPHSHFRTRRARRFFPLADSTIVISVRSPASGGRDRTIQLEILLSVVIGDLLLGLL